MATRGRREEPKVVADNSALPAGAVFDERYEIVRCIGKGGMGVVYEAIHFDTRRRRALKVMLASKLGKQRSRDRFREEATVVSSVESEHITEIIDAGVDDESGAPYIVMELLRGEELAQMLARRGPLPAEEVVELLWQAALALDKTHAAGIVHRDLKPENLFVTQRDDGRPWVKLLDFGIAKNLMVDTGAKTTKGVVGTPLYLAPEQVHGRERQAPQTDIYALTQIGYTLLVGDAYWKHDPSIDENLYGKLLAVMTGITDSACERSAKHSDVVLPAAFDAWFAKGSALQPTDRYGSCTELVAALAAAFELSAPGPVAAPAFPSLDEPDSAAGASAVPTADSVTTEATTATVAEPSPPVRSPWLILLAVAALIALAFVGTRMLAGDSGAAAPTSSSQPAQSPPTSRPSEAATSPSVAASQPSAAPPPTATVATATPSATASPRPSARPAAVRPAAPKPSAKGWTPPVTER